MRPHSAVILFVSALSLAGCNSLTTSQIASISCAEAEAGANVAVVVTTDADSGANATKAAQQASETAATIEKAVNDACPIVISGASALTASVSGGASSGK